MTGTGAPTDGELVLLASGPGRQDLTPRITSVIAARGGTVLRCEQVTTAGEEATLHFRAVVRFPEHPEDLEGLRAALAEALPAEVTWRIVDRSVRKRMVVLASRSDHCLLELLWRHRRQELAVDIPLVISNHRDVQAGVEFFGIPFVHVPSGREDKTVSETRILELIRDTADVVVLARYMQVLSEDFLEALGVPVINIHHSFLPAFVGAAPYRRAWERGVKLIGATAHYVTPELDAGPIIEQDVARIDHTFSADALRERGAYVERAVLSRAVQAHLEDRVLREGNRTIVFP